MKRMRCFDLFALFKANLQSLCFSGNTLFMVLSREDAVEGWRSLMGPTDPSEAKETAPDT